MENEFFSLFFFFFVRLGRHLCLAKEAHSPDGRLEMEFRNGKVQELRGKQITGNLYVLIFVCILEKNFNFTLLINQTKAAKDSKGFSAWLRGFRKIRGQATLN